MAVILVLHHVLADGMGGLALLAGLAAGDPRPGPDAKSVTRQELYRDAARSRLASLRHLGATLRQARSGAAELVGGGRPRRVPPTSLTLPTSGRRVLRHLERGLAPLRSAAHGLGVSINDVVVAVAAGALFEELQARGERPAEVVVSVPIAIRGHGDELGNHVGVVPVAVPRGLPLPERARVVAARTGPAKGGSRGSSALLLGWLFRGLGAVRLAQFFVDHQRLVHTFETNLRGPEQPLVLQGCPVERIVPVAVNPGNVAVSFDVLSYAGRLGMTIVMDPAAVPDPERLVGLVEREFGRLMS
jgi:hypothetical protein